MAGETTFRTSAPVAETTTPEVTGSTDKKVSSTTAVEVPYLDYARSNAKPFSVDYFGLGDTWNNPVGGFPKEIGIIEGYFTDQISSGEIANSISAVKERMKEMLKVTNMSKEERNVLKIETIAAYIKFLTEKDGISKSVKRYGNTE